MSKGAYGGGCGQRQFGNHYLRVCGEGELAVSDLVTITTWIHTRPCCGQGAELLQCTPSRTFFVTGRWQFSTTRFPHGSGRKKT